ncbi:MFS transporter [Rheinheimera muenzenbergensis]|uniref:MFS transporter n=1 Tax=Rheinheimera muenzenbergensis TaxID=1193628 RepID=A0ABU8C461_9GAMM
MNQHGFLRSFMLLAVFGGVAIGLGRVVTTFYALHLGANNAQIGYIAALEAFGRLLVTLPAGFIIARYGARSIYALSSLVPMLLNACIPWVSVWYGVALTRGLVGLAIPFRIVAMNSSFLQQLHLLGPAKTGWYRGAQSFGVMILGPVLASLMVSHTSYTWSYLLVALMFGIMALCSHKVLPGEEAAVETAHTIPAEGFLLQLKALWNIRAVRDSCVVEFVNSATGAVFTTFILVLALTVAMLPDELAVMLVTIQGLTTVTASFALGHLLAIMDRKKVQLLSVLLAIAGLLLLGTCLQFIWLAIGTVLLGSGSSLIGLSRTLQLSQLPVSKSKISGIYNLSNMSGAFVGAIAGGLLGEWLGLQGLFLLWIPVFLLTLYWANRKEH